MDTGTWIALCEPRDRNHPAAKRVLHELRARRERLITGWHTLVELADGLERHYGQDRAAREVLRLMASPRVQVEASEPYRAMALDLFRTRVEWEVDLSDCISFAPMKETDLRRAFTFDGDCQKAGFEVPPG